MQTENEVVEAVKAEQATDSQPIWVDDRYLAAYTPISRVCWQRWRQVGEGPKYYRVSRRILYKLSEVTAWLESDCVGGAS